MAARHALAGWPQRRSGGGRGRRGVGGAEWSAPAPRRRPRGSAVEEGRPATYIGGRGHGGRGRGGKGAVEVKGRRVGKKRQEGAARATHSTWGRPPPSRQPTIAAAAAATRAGVPAAPRRSGRARDRGGSPVAAVAVAVGDGGWSTGRPFGPPRREVRGGKQPGRPRALLTPCGEDGTPTGRPWSTKERPAHLGQTGATYCKYVLYMQMKR